MASGLTQQHVAPLVLSSAANFSHGLCCTPVSVLLAVPPPSLSLILLPDSTFGVFQRVLEPLFFFFFVLHYFLSYFLWLFKYCLYANGSQNISSLDFSKYLEFPNGYCTQHLSLGVPGHLKLNISKTNLLISHPSHPTLSSIVAPTVLPTLPEAQGKSLGFHFLLPTPSLSVELTSFVLNIY